MSSERGAVDEKRMDAQGEAKRLQRLEAAIFAYTGMEDVDSLLAFIENCRDKVREANAAAADAVTRATAAEEDRDRALREAGRAMAQVATWKEASTMTEYYQVKCAADPFIFTIGNRAMVVRGVIEKIVEHLRHDWKVPR